MTILKEEENFINDEDIVLARWYFRDYENLRKSKLVFDNFKYRQEIKKNTAINMLNANIYASNEIKPPLMILLNFDFVLKNHFNKIINYLKLKIKNINFLEATQTNKTTFKTILEDIQDNLLSYFFDSINKTLNDDLFKNLNKKDDDVNTVAPYKFNQIDIFNLDGLFGYRLRFDFNGFIDLFNDFKSNKDKIINLWNNLFMQFKNNLLDSYTNKNIDNFLLFLTNLLSNCYNTIFYKDHLNVYHKETLLKEYEVWLDLMIQNNKLMNELIKENNDESLNFWLHRMNMFDKSHLDGFKTNNINSFLYSKLYKNKNLWNEIVSKIKQYNKENGNIFNDNDLQDFTIREIKENDTLNSNTYDDSNYDFLIKQAFNLTRIKEIINQFSKLNLNEASNDLNKTTKIFYNFQYNFFDYLIASLYYKKITKQDDEQDLKKDPNLFLKYHNIRTLFLIKAMYEISGIEKTCKKENNLELKKVMKNN